MYYVLAIGVGVTILASLGWSGWVIARSIRRRRLYGAKPSLIEAVIGNLPASRWVRGRVLAADELLSAPLSGRACVCYELSVNCAYAATEKLGRLVCATDFLLSDGSGTARVVADGITSLALPDDYIEYDKAAPLAAPIRNRLEELGVIRRTDTEYRVLTIWERILAPGEEAELRGVVGTERDPDPAAVTQAHGYRDAPDRALVQRCELRSVRDTGAEYPAAALRE